MAIILYVVGSDDKLRSVYRRAKPKDLDSAAANIAPYVYQGSMALTIGDLYNFLVVQMHSLNPNIKCWNI